MISLISLFLLKASSPDEKALVEAAYNAGFEYAGQDQNHQNTHLIYRHNRSKVQRFQIDAVFEFDSNRKRMSVLMRHEASGRCFVICKGADTVMLDERVSGILSNKSHHYLGLTELLSFRYRGALRQRIEKKRRVRSTVLLRVGCAPWSTQSEKLIQKATKNGGML